MRSGRSPQGGGGQEDDLLEYYLDAMRVEGKSPKTIKQYRYVLRRTLTEVGIPCQRITVHHLRSWLAKEQARGISDSTLENDRQQFIAFWGWMRRENLVDRDPTVNLGKIKCAKKRRPAYSDVELEKIHESCECTRDRAIVAFLESTGCRVSEMTQLNRDEVDLTRRVCTVRGKGNKERLVYIDQVTAMLIERYLAERTDDCPALFMGRAGIRLEPDGVRVMLNKVAARAGVEHVHPHRFRRTLATNLTRHGMPLQEVAEILGHEKVDTTMRYVVIDNEDVEHSYRRYA